MKSFYATANTQELLALIDATKTVRWWLDVEPENYYLGTMSAMKGLDAGRVHHASHHASVGAEISITSVIGFYHKTCVWVKSEQNHWVLSYVTVGRIDNDCVIHWSLKRENMAIEHEVRRARLEAQTEMLKAARKKASQAFKTFMRDRTPENEAAYNKASEEAFKAIRS